VADAARRAGIGVVLSGTGGDEVFLGYGHHRRGAALDGLRRALAAVPAAPRRALLRTAATAGAAIGRSGLARLPYLASSAPAAAYLAVRGLFGPGEVCELLGIGEAELARLGPPLADGAGEPSGATVEALEFTHYLQDQLLRDTDVMSMAHSVEVRVPYLDHPLVDYVRGLPAAVRRGGAGPKALLVRALGDALPREVWDRPKMGFTLPFAWLRERAGELRAASAERSGLERRAVEAVWDRFGAGRVHWSRPWALAVLAGFGGGRGVTEAST
jgi:asparagine synthase (glutamine-hydrolysing)